ncbi:Cytochrome P450 [Macrophomina phaseolina MS6]|uniref:Cytochrome P450 n=1 Tax=Macrophomina phaseolina (strain MS6) TaxID=1126212 RepID=K2S193_MACPH|nr:Cytochrome P450 [Macrophomina phaseolina MS6]
MENLTGDNWLDGYMNAVLKEIHATLAPGPNLDKINRSVAKDLTAAINALAGKTTRVELLEWFRHQFSLSSTNAMYGPHNPFKDRKVEDGFWAFDYGVSNLLISPKPSVTCPKGGKGCKDAWYGFIKYFENKYHKQGSAMVKARYRIAAEHGIPDDDIGRLEVTMIIGVLTNTVPAGFWMVFYIWTNPEILAQLREEVGKVVVERTDADGTPLRVLSMVDLKNSCPLLNGAFSETLRMRTCGISSRVVTQDIVINKEYLLKQGSVVELPNHVTHSEPELWGPTVDQFLPRRFVKGMNADLKQPKGAYRPFGSGASLCAGRHQTTSQLVSALVLLVMGFEFKPVQGDWKYPGSHGHTVAAAMDSPDHDIQVEITPRKGYENVRWLLQAEPIA